MRDIGRRARNRAASELRASDRTCCCTACEQRGSSCGACAELRSTRDDAVGDAGTEDAEA